MNLTISIYNVKFNIKLAEGFFSQSDAGSSDNHNHSCFELVFFEKYKGILQFDHDSYNISDNTFYLVAPCVYHKQKCTEEIPVKYSIRFDYEVRDNEEEMPFEYETVEIVKSLSNTEYIFENDKYNSILLIKDVIREVKECRFGYYSKTKSILTQIMVNVLRTINKDMNIDSTVRRNKVDLFNSNLAGNNRREMLDLYFRENYWKNVTPEELAAELFISCNHLNRILKKLYNLSFKQKLLNTRLEVAKDLLRNSEMAVNDVSEKVGYLQACSFFHVFKKNIGITPNKYRSLYRKGEL